MSSTTHKTTYFQKILVQSKKRLNPTTSLSNNFKLRFQENIEGKHIVRWTTIPNTIYNINESNNRVYFTDSTPNTFAVSLPLGNYNGAQLAAALELAMDAPSSVNYTVVFNAASVDQKISVTANGANTFNFDWSNTENSAALALGFVPGVDTVTSAPGGTLVSQNPLFLGCPLSLGLQIQEAGDSGYVTAGTSFALGTTITNKPDGKAIVSGQRQVSDTKEGSLIIPLIAQYGVYNFQSSDIHKQYLTFRTAVKELNIRVVDPLTNELVNLNGGEWDMCIERVEGNETPSKRKRRKFHDKLDDREYD